MAQSSHSGAPQQAQRWKHLESASRKQSLHSIIAMVSTSFRQFVVCLKEAFFMCFLRISRAERLCAAETVDAESVRTHADARGGLRRRPS